MSRMEHHDKDNEQVFTRSARMCRVEGIGRRRAAREPLGSFKKLGALVTEIVRYLSYGSANHR